MFPRCQRFWYGCLLRCGGAKCLSPFGDVSAARLARAHRVTYRGSWAPDARSAVCNKILVTTSSPDSLLRAFLLCPRQSPLLSNPPYSLLRLPLLRRYPEVPRSPREFERWPWMGPGESNAQLQRQRRVQNAPQGLAFVGVPRAAQSVNRPRNPNPRAAQKNAKF